MGFKVELCDPDKLRNPTLIVFKKLETISRVIEYVGESKNIILGNSVVVGCYC